MFSFERRFLSLFRLFLPVNSSPLMSVCHADNGQPLGAVIISPQLV